MNETVLATLVAIAAASIRLATPYLYASIGEMFAQRSGVLNLGVDGIMLVGAFAAFYGTLMTGSLWVGVLAAVVAGLAMGLLMSVISVTLKAEQGISGIGLSLFGLGLSSLLFKTLVGTVKTVDGFQPIRIPLLGDVPYLGDIFFSQSLPVYVAFLLVPVSWYVLERTPWGLKVRAVGQNPAAADTLGVNVDLTRYLCVCLGAMLAGLAGASLSIALVNLFQENLTAGAGYIAVALVYFGGWRPIGDPPGRAAVQHGHRHPASDAGARRPDPVGLRGDAALHPDHRRPDLLRQSCPPAGGARQAIRTGRGLTASPGRYRSTSPVLKSRRHPASSSQERDT